MSNYVFQTDDTLFGEGQPKFFYGLRRNQEGELFLTRQNLLTTSDTIVINNPGPPDEDYVEFEYGLDYIDNINEEHEILFSNLFFSQYRWDQRSIYYYLSDDGSFIVRINQKYTYENE